LEQKTRKSISQRSAEYPRVQADADRMTERGIAAAQL